MHTDSFAAESLNHDHRSTTAPQWQRQELSERRSRHRQFAKIFQDNFRDPMERFPGKMLTVAKLTDFESDIFLGQRVPCP